MLHHFKQGISHLFFPVVCEGCDRPLVGAEEVLCISCAAQIPETGFHNYESNEAAQRLAGRIPFINATAFAHFTDDGLLQHLLHGLKYQHKKGTALYLGRLFGQQLLATDWIKNIDVIVPVPLHPKKEAKRGFNQATVIAQGMAGVLGIPVSTTALLRTRETESQTQKSRTERVTNMKDAFCINPREQLKQKHILICDDVLTTGATIEACALAFLAEETIKISVATIGIAAS